uniref:Putative secreted protein n=1 Tax=Xenopsylla cheopis TaxID=163159 RepID=A0A6M2DZR6_XENCH
MEGAVVLLVYALALFYPPSRIAENVPILRIWLANLVRRISPFLGRFLRRILMPVASAVVRFGSTISSCLKWFLTSMAVPLLLVVSCLYMV